jgi:hypothetical protein
MTGTSDRAHSAHPGGDQTSHTSNPFSLLPYERERFPFESSILWNPNKRWVIGEEALERPDLVIEQRVFVTIRHEMLKDLDGETIGVLLGHVLECPWTQRIWVNVVSSIGARLETDGEPDHAIDSEMHTDSSRALESALMSILGDPSWTGGMPVGWYRTRPGVECALTEAEASVHQRVFREPWHFSLLMLSNLTASQGGLFVRNEGETLQRERHWSFFERLDGSTDPNATPPFTCVGFHNYTTDSDVVAASPPPADRTSRDSQLLAPVVMGPGDRPLDSVRRGRRSALALAVSVAVVGGAGLLLRGDRSLLSSAPGTTDFSGPPAVSVLPEVSADEPFSDALGEFRTEVYNYYERSHAFQREDVGCDRLTHAYRTTEDAFIRLSGDVAAAGDAGGAEPPTSYRSATEVMRGIDQHFDAAGCPRPQ